MTNNRWTGLAALAALTIGVLSGPPCVRAQAPETVGVVTEIKIGAGVVEVKSGGVDWRVAVPLNALRAGDQIRAGADASVVILLTGGRGTVRIEARNSPYAVPARQAPRERPLSPVAEAQQWRIERSVATRQWETEKKISPYRKSQFEREPDDRRTA